MTAPTLTADPAAGSPAGSPDGSPAGATAEPIGATAESTAPAAPVRRPAGVLAWAIGAVWLAAFAALAVLVWPVTLGGATSLTIVSGRSMEPTYHTGDLAIVRRGGDIAVGDVIVYRVPQGAPGEGRRVIHRVIGGNPVDGFVTRGDNRDSPDIWHPRDDDVVGTVRAIVPQGGTWALRALSPIGLGLVAAGLLVWVLWPSVVRAGDTDELGDGGEVGEGGDAGAGSGGPADR